MNSCSSFKVVLVILAASICAVPEVALAQSLPTRRENVRSGPATLQVTISGEGEPVIFIPSRGRGVEDFEALSQGLVRPTLERPPEAAAPK